MIGGGLAGATVAANLARAGRTVLLVEKSTAAHDKMCGDFLSYEALHYLGKAGLDAVALGAAHVKAVRLVNHEIVAEAALPFAAHSLRRRILDEALLARAVGAGACLHRGATVQALTHTRARHIARLHDGNEIASPAVFLATGKHALRGRPPRRGWQDDLVAFKMYFRLHEAQQAELRENVELILFPGGYAGLQPVDAGLANLCLLITRQQLHTCGACWPNLLEYLCKHSRHLRRRLNGATQQLERPLALSSIPYGFLAGDAEPGLWPLGDQAAVIPSLSGDGMSIAMHSANLASVMFLGGETSRAFTQEMRADLRPSVGLATCISHLLVRAPWAAKGIGWFPFLLPLLASSTRIPKRALL